MSQCNLHGHSEGSFLDGLASVQEMARHAREVGSDATAITDHNECNQHLAFQKACRAQGIHPILGIEADWVYDLSETRELSYPTNRSHICLLAENNVGLSNIWALSSIAYTDKYRYYKPLITPELMREYREGVYFSDGCMLTELGRAVEKGDEDLARQHFGTLLDIGGDHFYSELHTWQFINPDTDEKKRLNTLMTQINQTKVRFATEMGVPLVVVNDSHHAYPHQWENRELVWQFSTGKRKEGDESYGQKADHLMGGDELYEWMARHGIASTVVDEAVKNSAVIANACHAEIIRTLDMPRLTRSDEDDLEMLLASVERGWKQKIIGGGLPEEVYAARLEEELRLIIDKRFMGYFNVERDLVGAAVSGDWAPYVKATEERQPMLCGPGRGSGGGSLVNWLLGITALDPIHYGLLFDRFLAPGRKDWPDIDVDFPQSMRPGAKRYLEVRHGHDCVCTIGILNRSQPKAILKDLCRAMGIWKKAPADVIAMSKIIDQVKAVTVEEGDDEPSWEEVIEQKGGELASWQRRYPQLFTKINEMVGYVRQCGQHPSGMVVSSKPLMGNIPLRTQKNQVITQLDMYEVEELGAVKLDLLGLRHLDGLMHARNLIYERKGIWLDYRDDALPENLRGALGATRPSCATIQPFGYKEYADPVIWPQIASGHTVGIFQVETADLTRTAIQLKPQNEEDVAVLISIVRPGVGDVGLKDVYLKRRAGKSFEYDHPMMECITRETYGVLVYQEQLLRTVKELAGFTADEADDLRKALGKKMMDKVIEFKAKFYSGCSDHNIDWVACEKIWKSIEASGRYAFNKSHAVGYAIISTWEIWTKHYYPLEFLVACMVTDPENLNNYVRDARRMGIEILPPDVNLSDKFQIIDGVIRYGLDAIHGLGSVARKEIVAQRPYTSLANFLDKVDGRKVSRGHVEALIKVGAFDMLGHVEALDGGHIPMCRGRLLTQYHDHRIFEKAAEGKQALLEENMFGRAKHVQAWRAKHAGEEEYEKEFAIPDFSSEAIIYQIEHELVGNHITVDPMEPYLEAIKKKAISDPVEIDGFELKEQFHIGGQLIAVTIHRITKPGRNMNREMAWLSIEWNGQSFEITVFPELFDQTRPLLTEGIPVLCEVARDNRGCHLLHLKRLDMKETNGNQE